MAKIIIGNVKGKDGRGITKIVKTASTESVDTYTIVYTDNTTSTFTINNSNSISLQRQIVPSAAVESSTTASQAYTAGQYVVVAGVLRRVTGAIAKGNTISNSNSTATTVGGELGSLANSVSRKQFRLGESLTCYVEGGICIVSTDYLNVKTANTFTQIGTLPDGLKPLGVASNSSHNDSGAYIAPLRYRGEDSMSGQLMVDRNGLISVYVNRVADSYYYGQLVFPVSRP
jgi:hypothetical protein